jgi:hypothetical protein
MLEFKQHLPQQDIQVLARRLEEQVKSLPKARAVARPLLLAPYVPPKQAAFLRGRHIDYADEAGNAHLQAPGVLVHIEGKRPVVTTTARRGITKGWVKVTLALSRRSVDFFKRAAKSRRVPYQRMIRALVDAYAERQEK